MNERDVLRDLKRWDKTLLEIQNQLATIHFKGDAGRRNHWCWLSLLRFREDELNMARYLWRIKAK